MTSAMGSTLNAVSPVKRSACKCSRHLKRHVYQCITLIELQHFATSEEKQTLNKLPNFATYKDAPALLAEYTILYSMQA